MALIEGTLVEAVPWGLLAQGRMAWSLVDLQVVACSDPGVGPFAQSLVAADEKCTLLNSALCGIVTEQLYRNLDF